jgi:hypothetical protein
MKKLVPFTVLQRIQPLIEQHQDLIKVIKEAGLAFSFVDADKDSDFYFKVEHQNDRGRYVARFKPMNEDTVQPHAEETNVDGIVNLFTNWLGVLDKYAQLHTVFDDPFLKSYEAEFASYLKMAEPEADYVPFNFEKQLLLEQYLDWAASKIEEHKQGASDEQIAELDEMLNDVQTLKENLTQLSQNKTVEGVAKFWAKARKYSLSLMKQLWSEFEKEGIKKVVEKTLKGEYIKWEDISALIP